MAWDSGAGMLRCNGARHVQIAGRLHEEPAVTLMLGSSEGENKKDIERQSNPTVMITV